ncbi:Maf family protein [Kingella sp. SNUBH-2017]|uniref:Maf family protein n=1 Tax=Kingella sp. SNUBH-2017 TaxID=2994077 RepID=UPI0023640D59|nr:nucleoside triphosphate pyrophosphatase [Kingella sp. SNUBH-2017]MDD2182731.1 Maf family protein [Kingella sp. SNUBH-2017]
MDTPFPPLVLASTSPFRRAQLETLGLPFSAAAPDCDETPAAGESAAQTALRLAEGKARSLSAAYPAHLIIGADQVAFCNGRQLGKPLTIERARTMLAELSGRRIEFFSALCLLNTVSGCLHRHVDTTMVQMRSLTAAQIDRYLEREPDALYCAGAAKSEGLGALLIERIDSSDPNALIGLPIFRLADFLLAEGVPLL